MLAADAQHTENRRAELARRQGFPGEQPQRLFSFPVLGLKEMIDGAKKEFLANYGITQPDIPPAEKGKPATKGAWPVIPEEVAAQLEKFLRTEFGGTQ